MPRQRLQLLFKTYNLFFLGRSLGITVGKLGTSYVEVPASFLTRAQEVINTDYSDETEAWDDELDNELYDDDL